MNLRNRPTAIWAFPILMLLGALLFLGSDAGQTASRLRGILFDAYQHIQPRPYQDTLPRSGFAVRVLDSDADSLARFGPWPWPHATLAKLTRELKAKGAAMVVFAFPLDVPDPLSPANLLALTPAGPQGDAVRSALNAMPSPDSDLTLAMSQLATMTGFTLGTGNAARAPSPKSQVSFVGNKESFRPRSGFLKRFRRDCVRRIYESWNRRAQSCIRHGRQGSPHADGVSPERQGISFAHGGDAASGRA